MDKSEIKTVETGKVFVNELFETVMGAGENSLEALKELSGIAMGGNELARDLISQVDEVVAGGDLALPWDEVQTVSGVKKDNQRSIMPSGHAPF